MCMLVVSGKSMKYEKQSAAGREDYSLILLRGMDECMRTKEHVQQAVELETGIVQL